MTAPAALPVPAAALALEARSPATRRAYRRALASLDTWLAGRPLTDATLADHVAALEWRDIEPAPNTPGAFLIRVRVRRSKTDQEGAETDIRMVKGAAALALDALRPANAAPAGRVFGLNGQSIGRRFAAAARAAGIESVTAHSGRVGHASELTARGASTTEVMLSGGWKTARMVAHYAAGGRAAHGARRRTGGVPPRPAQPSLGCIRAPHQRLGRE